MNLDGIFSGQLIGYDISLNSGAVVNQSGPSTVISEPSTWAVLLLGFAGLGFSGFRASRKSRVAVGAYPGGVDTSGRNGFPGAVGPGPALAQLPHASTPPSRMGGTPVLPERPLCSPERLKLTAVRS